MTYPRVIFIVGLWLFVAGACSTPVSGGESETHWLRVCTQNSECGSGASCLCGVCTTSCEPGSNCSDGPPESGCVEGSASELCRGASNAPHGLCLPACEQDGAVCGAPVSGDPSCPSMIPKKGDSCSGAPYTCRYGSAPCESVTRCESAGGGKPSAWTATLPDASCSVLPEGCPVSFAAVTPGAFCTAGIGSPGEACTYAEGICQCVVCDTADAGLVASHAWACRRWGEDLARGCPALAPTPGDRCTSPKLLCHYGVCSASEIDLGSTVQCANGYWEVVVNTADCPPASCESLR